MADFPVTEDFARSANAAQLHDEARGTVPAGEWPACFAKTEAGWVYRVDRDTVDGAAVQAALDAHVPAPPPSPDDDLAARIQAVHDDPNVSAGVKKLTAALLGLNGEAAVAGRPTER
jgi:hypothetical protein